MNAAATARGGWQRRLLLLVVLAIVVIGIYLWPSGPTPALEIVFLDVGQGDATLIRTADGRTALIDGGRSPARLLEQLDILGITNFDLVIATHADFDHIAGLVPVLENFPVANFMDNGVAHTTQTYGRLIEAIEPSGARYLEATERTLTLSDVTLTVLPPPLQEDDQNGNSVGILLRYGQLEVLLQGDATTAEQRVWLSRYRDQLRDLDIYKAAHHGSRTGDAAEFLDPVSPEVVVISAGLDNSYGHPHPEALASYQRVGARVYRTDLDGPVTVMVGPGGASYSVSTGQLQVGGGNGWIAVLQTLLRELVSGL